MTVRALPPLIRYTGNGVITKYDWDWDMHPEDSFIFVLVNNENVGNWTLEGMSVVFDTPPDDGDEIIIYRRTIIWQPSNYRPFGRFHAEKTELNMDRAILIAQERQGDAIYPAEPNGIVGGSNLSITRGEFDVTVVSERGTDALLLMYDPDDVDPPAPVVPDPTIIWAGDALSGGVYGTESQNALLRFQMSFEGGDNNQASAFYNNFNAGAYASWCSVDPDDNEYWMRVNETSGLIASRFTINDSVAFQPENTPFKIRGNPLTGPNGPYMTVHTFGDAAPTTRTGVFKVEICKDNGSGLPDGAWVERTVTLKSILNADVPPPVDTTGSVSWASFFGKDFVLEDQGYDALKIIPTDGISIAFTIPNTGRAFSIGFVTVENTALSSSRTGSVGQTVGDYTSDPTFTWGTGGGIAAGVNFADPAIDIQCLPNQTYFFCVRNNTPSDRNNYIRIKVLIQEQ
jgi:hypothetical protein